MSVETKLRNLISEINETTGKNDADLSKAVASLKKGYLGDTMLQTKRINITKNGVNIITPDDGYNALAQIIVNASVAGEVSSKMPSINDVTFYDYDGRVLYSYSKKEFLELTEMPPLPAREGLICQGWTCDFDYAQSYVDKYGILDVGAFYVTDDEKTRLYITILSNETREAQLYFSQTLSRGVTIDWGDGSPIETLNGIGSVDTTHTYDRIGDYVISLDPSEECNLGLGGSGENYCVTGYIFQNDSVYLATRLKKVECGKRVTTLRAYAFSKCCNLSTVSLSNSVKIIEANAFNGASLINFLVLPREIDRLSCTFSGMALKGIVLPQGITSTAGYMFSSVNELLRIVIPEGMKELSSYMFASCSSLTSLVLPKSVQKINYNANNYCHSLRVMDMSQHESIPTRSGNDADPSRCTYYVPYNLYYEWQKAWPTVASKIKSDYTPDEYTSLEISAETIPGNFGVAIIRYAVTTNGFRRNGKYVEGVVLYGNQLVNIGVNKSTTESVIKEVSFTYQGLTATTTIEQGKYVEDAVACIYNADIPKYKATLLGTTGVSQFVSMIVDGEETDTAATYTFEESGLHYVLFKINTEQSVNPYDMFRGSTSLIYADCSELDLSDATSQSSSEGTANMFYNCTYVTTIILPETIKYLGQSMFYNCVRVENLTIKSSSAPSVYGTLTWGTSSTATIQPYIGAYGRDTGKNKLYVPIGATGYDAVGYNRLYDEYCGFTRVEVEF